MILNFLKKEKFVSPVDAKNSDARIAKNRGMILASTFVFGIIAISLIVALTSWFAVVLKSSRILIAKEQAFHVAEAGIEYYRWHLAHAPTDFTDGTGQPGPYVHDVTDKDGNVIGQFSLNVTAPENGTTIVEIESTGTVTVNPDVERTIRVRLAKPSFAKYAFVANSDMRFGAGTEVFGPIHSNGGVRFDGIAHNLVTSARSDYDDPDHSGANEFGVHTHDSPTDPLPPAAVPDRFDVFVAGRQFPVPAVDFAGMISDLADLKTTAQSADGRYFAESGGLGYRMVLKTNDTFDLYRVTSLRAVPRSSCTNSAGQSGWGTWSVQNSTPLGNYSFPSNGVIFVEDHLWISGQINTARLNIGAGRFPDVASTRRNIIINEDLLYTNYDGQDVIGLMAQNNIDIGLYSDTNLQIDAALIAQNGRVGRYYYPGTSSTSGCGPYHSRNSITLNGMIATYLRYGFAYSDNTGYITRNINYDANLLYGPPPQFPLVSDNYQTISWEEVVD